MKRLFGVFGVLLCTSTTWATSYVVSNSNDSGAGSLRQAILDANAHPNTDANTPDVINFAIPGNGVKTIAPAAVLPTITEAVVIDGLTQAGAAANTNDSSKGLNATLMVQLSGNAIAQNPSSIGLNFNGGRSTIRGLIINRFYYGLSLDGGAGYSVSCNYIGTDASGNVAPVHTTSGSAQHIGVIANGASASRIGSSLPAGRNLISGNADANVYIVGSASTGNLIQGNLIGTNAAGTADLVAIPNELGILLQNGASNNRVGGTTVGARNVISGNGSRGVAFFYGSAPEVMGNFVEGNFIGTDVTGTIAIPNLVGVELQGSVNTIGGTAVGATNVISGNSQNGIQTKGGPGVGTTNCPIQHNYIGTDFSGTKPLGNGGDGIDISNASNNNKVSDGNIIAFNGRFGVHIETGSLPGVGNSILGNSIHSNALRGIVLGNGPLIPNDAGDADAGPNNYQNFPVLASAVLNGDNTVTITGLLSSGTSQFYRIEFFGDVGADPSSYGEGRYLMGAANILTDSAGKQAFTITLPYLAGTAVVSATATSSTDDTSEFSQTTGIAGAPSHLLNIATRLRVLTGDNVLISGFIVTGVEPKRVIIRGLGPSLASQVSGVLQNPTLDLLDGASQVISSNDDWKDKQQAEIQATGIPPTVDAESAIVATVLPGNYTAILRGAANETGVGLVEVYDLDQAALSTMANVSTRGFSNTGDNVLIGGFIVGGPGNGSGRVVIRALGPSLPGVSGAMQDPTLEVYNGNGTLLAKNDDWKDTQQSELQATGIAPQVDAEAAAVDVVPAGNYTAVVRGKGGATGVALVEVYNVP